MDDNQKIIDKISEIYHFTQYGKLMPGFIHNINGKISAIDSKIQLIYFKTKLKLKKLSENKNDYTPEVYKALEQEISETIKGYEELIKGKDELNTLMNILNEKISGEFIPEKELLDINYLINIFHEYFKFYKRYKHNTKIELDLEGSPYIKMTFKDLNFLLYAIVRNGVDATFKNHQKGALLKITTKNFDDYVLLSIFNNGEKIKDKDKIFRPLYSDKDQFSNIDYDNEKPMGAGLDLFYLKKLLSSYGINLEIESNDSGTTFSAKLPKS